MHSSFAHVTHISSTCCSSRPEDGGGDDQARGRAAVQQGGAARAPPGGRQQARGDVPDPVARGARVRPARQLGRDIAQLAALPSSPSAAAARRQQSIPVAAVIVRHRLFTASKRYTNCIVVLFLHLVRMVRAVANYLSPFLAQVSRCAVKVSPGRRQLGR